MAKKVYRQLTQSQLKNRYGASASAVRSRLVSVVFDLGDGKIKMPMHKDVAPKFEKACADYKAKIKAGKAEPYKLIAKSCGTFNWRLIRGSSSTLSMHAFGIAVDLNAYNPNGYGYGAKSNIPPELVESFNKFGIYCGIDWSGGSYDPMHFEYAPNSDFGKVAKPKIPARVVPTVPKPSAPAKPAQMPKTVYLKKYTGKSKSLSDALKSLGYSSAFVHREKLAKANGIKNYAGTAAQNTKMLDRLKKGKLKKG